MNEKWAGKVMAIALALMGVSAAVAFYHAWKENLWMTSADFKFYLASQMIACDRRFDTLIDEEDSRPLINSPWHFVMKALQVRSRGQWPSELNYPSWI